MGKVRVNTLHLGALVISAVLLIGSLWIAIPGYAENAGDWWYNREIEGRLDELSERPGGLAWDYLTSERYDEISVTAFAPSEDSVSWLITPFIFFDDVVDQTCEKSSIQHVWTYASFPAKMVYSMDDVREAAESCDVDAGEGQAVVRILFLSNAPGEDVNELAFPLDARTIVIFYESMTSDVVQMELAHNMGHLLGLVRMMGDDGEYAPEWTTDHEDADHQGHCSNPFCVMGKDQIVYTGLCDDCHADAGAIAAMGSPLIPKDVSFDPLPLPFILLGGTLTALFAMAFIRDRRSGEDRPVRIAKVRLVQLVAGLIVVLMVMVVLDQPRASPGTDGIDTTDHTVDIWTNSTPTLAYVFEDQMIVHWIDFTHDFDRVFTVYDLGSGSLSNLSFPEGNDSVSYTSMFEMDGEIYLLGWQFYADFVPQEFHYNCTIDHLDLQKGSLERLGTVDDMQDLILCRLVVLDGSLFLCPGHAYINFTTVPHPFLHELSLSTMGFVNNISVDEELTEMVPMAFDEDLLFVANDPRSSYYSMRSIDDRLNLSEAVRFNPSSNQSTPFTLNIGNEGFLSSMPVEVAGRLVIADPFIYDPNDPYQRTYTGDVLLYSEDGGLEASYSNITERNGGLRYVMTSEDHVMVMVPDGDPDGFTQRWDLIELEFSFHEPDETLMNAGIASVFVISALVLGLEIWIRRKRV